jgi:DNA-binding NtrC family response regulator
LEPENRTNPEAKPSILVIDDDASILRVFTRVLEKRGFFVATARSGREAWEKVRTKSFDATLIDVGLPDMEGTDLMRRMGDLSPKMVKIVFTGSPLQESSLEATKTFADAFLLKPVKPETFLNILETKMREKTKVINARPNSARKTQLVTSKRRSSLPPRR